MKTFFLTVITSGVLFYPMASCLEVPADQIPPVETHAQTRPKKTMRPFRSEQELTSYFKELSEKQRLGRLSLEQDAAGLAKSAPAALARTQVGSKDDESVTNVQHAGVDEGGIVKLHGEHLVVLRRGRLFTVAIGDDQLKPVSVVDAFGPELDPRGTWYDEMLVSDDTIAVIGYSYERGGTEVGLFNINRLGKLSYRSTYHLRSNDYYSSRNYASRLINGKLIFYTPLYFWPGAVDPFQSFPAVRKWHKGATASEFRRIVSASRVYRPENQISPSYGLALHTVTVCDLRNQGFACEATAVVGPPGRVFYVSPESVYVWVSDWVRRGQQVRTDSMLYRMPLDGSAPSALKVSGSPVDQFSFLEAKDAHLNVLVRSDAVGDAMWGPEVAAGDVALMRVPLVSFSDGSEAVPASSLRKP